MKGQYQRTEGSAIFAGLLSLIVCAMAIGVIIPLPSFSLMDSDGQFFVSAVLIALPAVLSFIVGYTFPLSAWGRQNGWATPVRKTFELIALSVVFGATVLLVSFFVLESVYRMIGFALGKLYFTAIVMSLAAIGGYMGFSRGRLMDATIVSGFLPLFVISGIAVAGITTKDRWWWRNNFSELGDNTTFSALTFDFTLVMSGICLIIIGSFAVYELSASNQQYLHWRRCAGLPTALTPEERKQKKRQRRKQIRSAMSSAADESPAAVIDEMRTIAIQQQPNLTQAAALARSTQGDTSERSTSASQKHTEKMENIRQQLENDTSALVTHYRLRMGIFLALTVLAGVSLAGVGIFRYTPYPDMHNLCARGMMIPMYILLIFLPWLIPNLSKIVYALGWIDVVVIAAAGLLWMHKGTTLTNVEGLTWVLFIVWFIVLSRQIAAISRDRIDAQTVYNSASSPSIPS